MKQKIFIDTDMGNDDIMAIAYLLLQNNIDICGISVVNGVATKNNGTNNLCSLLNYLKRDIPIVMGRKKALKERCAQFPTRDTKRANELTLLNSLNISIKAYTPIKQTSEEFIFNEVKNNNAIVLALGPLTNIAKTIQKYGKQFTENLNELWIMGGGIQRGNVAPAFKAEYNIFLDPEAAQVVFQSEIPITMIGIDATAYVQVISDFTEKVRKSNPLTKEGEIIKKIIVNNDNDFAQYYDPLAAFLILNPKVIQDNLRTGISVKLLGKERGKTILNSNKSNVNVVMSVNSNEFYQEIIELLERR